jgi:hypothetical protein
VKVVSQEISTGVSTVTIENSEEGAFGPSFTFLLWRLLNIKNNTDSVFIIVTDYSLVGVSSITFDHSILFH